MRLLDVFKRHADAPVQGTVGVNAAIIDKTNDTLVAFGSHLPALGALSESLMDTTVIGRLSLHPNITETPPSSLSEWSWDPTQKKFKRTNPLLLNDELRDRSCLAMRKVAAIEAVMELINNYRAELHPGMTLQESIYEEKTRQAREIKAAASPEQFRCNFPYVADYADEVGLTLIDAADEILLQSKLLHEELAKTEHMRIATMRKMRRASTIEEVDNIVRTLQSEWTA